MGNLIRGTSLLGFKELVQELGQDPVVWMGRWNLPVDIARQPEASFPYRTLVQMLETSAVELDCPDIGIRLGNRQTLNILGPIAVIARNAATVGGAFSVINRFLYVHSPALQATLEQPVGHSYKRCRFRIAEPQVPLQRQALELSMTLAMQILRLLAGPTARPLGMYFPHTPLASAAAYQALCHCRLHFEQDWCGFHLPSGIANRPIENADPQTLQLAQSYLESHYGADTASASVQVKKLIRSLLPNGRCRIELIADQLGMHVRTLQRRLADEDNCYETMVDQQRRELAAHYLRESGMYIGQIANLVGYSEQSTFNRACQRWFNATPTRYRAQKEICRHSSAVGQLTPRRSLGMALTEQQHRRVSDRDAFSVAL